MFDKNIESLAVKLHAYEIILGKQKYIAGDVSFFLDHLSKHAFTQFRN